MAAIAQTAARKAASRNATLVPTLHVGPLPEAAGCPLIPARCGASGT